MPRDDVLVIRLEEAAKHLRLAVKEAEELNHLPIGISCVDMIATIEGLIPTVKDGKVLSCPNDPTACDGCGDGACFN